MLCVLNNGLYRTFRECLIATPRTTVHSKRDTTKLGNPYPLQITYWVNLFCHRPIGTHQCL